MREGAAVFVQLFLPHTFKNSQNKWSTMLLLRFASATVYLGCTNNGSECLQAA